MGGIGSIISAGMTNKRAKQDQKSLSRANQQLTEAMLASADRYRERKGDVQNAYQRYGQNIAGLYAGTSGMLDEMTNGLYGVDPMAAMQETPIQSMEREKPPEVQLGPVKTFPQEVSRIPVGGIGNPQPGDRGKTKYEVTYSDGSKKQVWE